MNGASPNENRRRNTIPVPSTPFWCAPHRSFNRARLRRNAFSGPMPSTTMVGRTNKVAMAHPDPRIRDTIRPPASDRIAVSRKSSPTVAAHMDQTRIWKKLALAASTPSIIIVVGRLSFQVRLLALVRCVDEAHDLRGLPGPNLRRVLEFLRGRVEDRSYRAEPLQEISGEGLADARQPFDQEPLPLPEAQRLRLVSEPVLGRALVLAFPEDLQDEGRLFLVRRRQDGHAFLQLHREESAQEGLRMLERRELRQIPFEDEQGLRICLSEPLDLLEEAFADERVEEVREGLAFDPDGSQDVIARRDLLDLDRHAELSQSVGNVLRFVRIDDEGNAHGRPIRGTDVNVPVGGRNQPR